MAVSYTTTYNLTKPEVGASEDQWGGLLNDNLDDLDNLLDGTTPVTGIDINSGTIDGTVIGGTTPAAGTFTALTSNGIDDNATSTAMTLDASGKVGIGTDSPTEELEIYAGVPTIRLSDSDGSYSRIAHNAAVMIFEADSGGVGTGAMKFEVGGTERMHIASNGDISFYEDTGTTPQFFWDASSERLGIGTGTNAPGRPLELRDATPGIRLTDATAEDYAEVIAVDGDLVLRSDAGNSHSGSIMQFAVDGTEAMRIDSSGNVLVGKTSSSFDNTAGIGQFPSGRIYVTRDGGNCLYLNRVTSDGDLAAFYKDGTVVGSIGTDAGQIYIGNGPVGLRFDNASPYRIVPFRADIGTEYDNAIDLGRTVARFDDIYATNGTIQTSDRNEKQDIDVLSDAEQRVAVACKGLLRKFRWKDAVAEKGDDARIHFGIIAQDLQDAFAAEGLDAGDYAMFISTTWWETQTDVPAVEAVEAVDAVYEDVVIPAVEEVLDEEGNVVTEAQPERIEQRLVTEAVEAVEAKEAYTRTDTYETAEEAPEGATERTRLGVRYPELLAFIIAAI